MWKMASSSVSVPAAVSRSIERQQEHVQPAQRAAAVVHPRGGLVPEHPLARLAEGLRRLGHEAAVDRGDLSQVRARAPGRAPARGQPRGGVRRPSDPVLHPQHDVAQPVVERLRLRVRVDCPVIGDLVQQAAPAQVQPDLQIVAEVLRAADAGVEPVALLVRVEVGVVEVRVPADRAVGAEVDHVAAGERAVRVEVDRVRFEQAAEVAAERHRAEEAAARVVALGCEPLHLDVHDGHTRCADGVDDLARSGGGRMSAQSS